MNLRDKKFIASYSGGKDSIFAVYRAIKTGLVPAGLITTYRTDGKNSWFHGISSELISRVSASLSIPSELIYTNGGEYEASFEKTLSEARQRGVEVCVFGDIDIEGHLEWCTKRCENTGMIPYFPLWKEERRKLVYEFIDSGFSTLITIVDTSRLSEEFLGKTLTREVADLIEAQGADICGENGEYHSFAYNGPIFSTEVQFRVKGTINRDKYAVLDIE